VFELIAAASYLCVCVVLWKCTSECSMMSVLCVLCTCSWRMRYAFELKMCMCVYLCVVCVLSVCMCFACFVWFCFRMFCISCVCTLGVAYMMCLNDVCCEYGVCFAVVLVKYVCCMTCFCDACDV